MLKKFGMTAAAAALSLGALAAVAAPAGAAAKVPLGNATGTVSCPIAGKVKISPPLSSLNTLPSTTTAKIKNTAPCTGSGGSIGAHQITKMKSTVTSTGTSAGTCSGVTGVGTTPFTANLSWKPTGATMNPTTITFANNGPSGVGFDLPSTGALGANTSVVTGSFQGEGAWAHATADPSVIAAITTPGICTPDAKGKAKGLKKITIIGGSINIAP